MLFDKARVNVSAGRGGDGCVSFRREAHVPKGGPDGGDGGHGGDIVLVCEPSLRDLVSLRHGRHIRADKGANGEGAGRHGARGEEQEVRVPPGTQVQGLGGELIDMLTPGQRVVLAHGGRGGHGNRRFTTSTRQAPRFAERGSEGEEGWVELRLKLLADAGLVGLPNAGKSSLLARITRAAPKVGDYPFTTLEPVLGVLDDGDRQAVVADIPGLIGGAAEGAGLGHEFLAHIERCRVLVHLIEIAPEEGEPREAYETIRGELSSYGAGLADLPELVVLSKRDLVDEEWADEMAASLGPALEERYGEEAPDPLVISSATGANISLLGQMILDAVGDAEPIAVPLAGSADPLPSGFEFEHRVYRPEGEGGYRVELEDDGVYRILGKGVEILFSRHDLKNEEALSYLEQRLKEMGVLAALAKAGFAAGDEVRIGEHEFELYPGASG